MHYNITLIKKTIFAYGMNDKNKQKHLPIIQKKRKT